MASRPLLRKLIEDIEADGGEETIFERLANGETTTKIMGSYYHPDGKPFSRWMIYHWLKAGGPERQRGYEEALKQRADTYADDALEIVDESALADEAHQVTAAKNRADMRKWLASVHNREKYGTDKGAEVTINLAGLHLQALQAAGAPQHMLRADVVEDDGEDVVQDAPLLPRAEDDPLTDLLDDA